MSATLVLRLHQLLNGSNDAELPKSAVDSIMTLPQLSVGNLTGRDQVQHFMRFSIEYLRRAGLLDEAGRCVQNLFATSEESTDENPSVP